MTGIAAIGESRDPPGMGCTWQRPPGSTQSKAEQQAVLEIVRQLHADGVSVVRGRLGHRLLSRNDSGLVLAVDRRHGLPAARREGEVETARSNWMWPAAPKSNRSKRLVRRWPALEVDASVCQQE